MAPPRIIPKEMWFPRKYFTDIGGWEPSEFQKFIREHPDIDKTSEGYPVFKIMKEYIRDMKVGYINKEDDIDRQLKEEKLQDQRIKNQERMGQLIDRMSAKRRVITSFNSFVSKIKYAIKLVSPQLIGVTNPRDVENMLINNYNQALNFLEQEAKLISWEFDGVENKLGRTASVKAEPEGISSGSSEEGEAATAEQHPQRDQPDIDSLPEVPSDSGWGHESTVDIHNSTNSKW